MAERSRRERVEIGFVGGQVIAVRVAEEKLKDLRKKVSSTAKNASEAGRWFELEGEDGAVTVDLTQIIFVRTAAPEHRIGFTTES